MTHVPLVSQSDANWTSSRFRLYLTVVRVYSSSTCPIVDELSLGAVHLGDMAYIKSCR